MKFGIFYELQLPRPWQPDSELRLYQNALDQVELADRLGYDFAWEVEHHFLEEYSHSPAPEVFLGAASQRTKQIRLAHGIMQLTTSPPARVAGRRGLGALAFQFLSAEAAHAWVHAYYNAFTKRLDKPADYQTNPNLALTSYFMCAPTDE